MVDKTMQYENVKFIKIFSENGARPANGVEHLTLVPATLKVDLDHLTCGTWEAQSCRIHANIVSLCLTPFPLAEAGYSAHWCGFLGRY